ncbi:TRAP transporter large permease subunit [Aeromonas sp. 102P]|uniref:TRAP transporter large permease subunit n=1 Tax=Aeromonas sp. 102P TaxID=3452711 RepID=UPI003F79091C
MDIAQQAILMLLGVFFVLLISGTPIAIVMVLAALVSIMPFIPLDSSIFIASQKIFAGLDSFALIALPFFIFAGNLMNRSGVAIKLIEFSKLLVGFIPGALALTNILGNMIFGAISGWLLPQQLQWEALLEVISEKKDMTQHLQQQQI